MAVLLLGAAASAVTSSAAFGGLLGGGLAGTLASSALGGAANIIGRSIDSRLFGGSRLASVEGPRLGDLSVQTSTYGRMIPIVYGNARIAGNVIWALPIKETATTNDVSAGGKGTGGKVSQSQTTYSYSITLAIAICEGEINDIIRVWADASEVNPTLGTYRLYRGTEDQLPDTLIESIEGVGSTPAYRGLAYVVIEDFPLANYGNRIPNFTFEVKKKALMPDEDGDILENMITGMVVIPGSGEFVYDTVVQSKVAGEQTAGGWVQNGPKERINQHHRDRVEKTDAMVAIDQLQETCPNVEWIALVVTWFGNSMDAGDCIIKPGVEYTTGATTEPDSWAVGSFNRTNAHVITLDGGGNPIYGGTPNDASLLRYLDYLRASPRNYKVMFYPMFFMDVEGKPWRGRVTGTATEVDDFFTKTDGYNAFITHYANLVAGKVDAFVIGSELIGLTKVKTDSNSFPAVDRLVTLAGTVRGILGSSVKITYAADWSEYHHTEDGWYNLDPLWASPNIDMVGIDAYFPLTNAPQNGYKTAPVIEGWTSGEGYDFYYSDPERTIQEPLDAPYAWKNIAWWWSNTHTNPDTTTTGWIPESKKIWFTEYGFPSIDGATNQPNVFYDPNSVESYFPRFSKGRVDFLAQRQGLMATEKKWKNSTMIEQKFVWTWDARPYPFWPDLEAAWKDGPLWKTGHWVTGKLGLSNLGAIVADISYRSGLQPSDIDVAELIDPVEGFVISQRMTARRAIELLMQGYIFDAVESDYVLRFPHRGKAAVASLAGDNLIPEQQGNERRDVLSITRTQEQELPARMEVLSINRLSDYQTGEQYAERLITQSERTETLNLPIVFSEQSARNLADIALYNRWQERTRYSFLLPVEYAKLEPGDVITITLNGTTHMIRLTEVTFGRPGLLKVRGVAEDVTIYDFYSTPGVQPPTITPLPAPGKTLAQFLDLPLLPGDNPSDTRLKVALSGEEATWAGSVVYRSDDGGANYNPVYSTQVPATAGAALGVLAAGPSTVFDRVNNVIVSLSRGELASITEAAMLNGGNLALLGNEIIQFKTATLIAPFKYTLSFLLRGRLGTEQHIGTHAAGERFILLNQAIGNIPTPLALLGLSRLYKPVTIGTTLGATDGLSVTLAGNSLKPWSPVHASGVRDESDNLTIRWVRRTRYGGELRDFADVPLAEESERYEVEVYDGATLVRTITGLTSQAASYTAAQQISDFGSVQSSVAVKIYQLSALVGRGAALSATV